jgi:hypothetical protein
MDTGQRICSSSCGIGVLRGNASDRDSHGRLQKGVCDSRYNPPAVGRWHTSRGSISTRDVGMPCSRSSLCIANRPDRRETASSFQSGKAGMQPGAESKTPTFIPHECQKKMDGTRCEPAFGSTAKVKVIFVGLGSVCQ